MSRLILEVKRDAGESWQVHANQMGIGGAAGFGRKNVKALTCPGVHAPIDGDE
jgi:hypothetical protein